MRYLILLGALELIGCARSFSSYPPESAIGGLLGQRISTPRYAYISSPATNHIFTYNVDSSGQLTQTNFMVQGTSPTLLAPDTAGRFLHFQTTGANTIHWRSTPTGGVPTTGSSLTTTGGAFLFRSVVYPSWMIGLVAGGGSSLQTYTIASDGAIAPQTAGLDPGTNYSSMVQHPTLPLVYVLENAGANIHVSSISSSGVFTMRASVAATAASAIAIDPGGKFLLLANANAANNLTYYALDSTGMPTQGASITAGGAFNANLVIHPLGGYAYVARQTSGLNLLTVQISPLQVVATNLSQNTPGNSPTSLLIDNSGRFLYVAGSAPGGVTLHYVPWTGGIPVQAASYATPAAPTIGLYHTSRCAFAPEVDC